jgi:hypothetical protein
LTLASAAWPLQDQAQTGQAPPLKYRRVSGAEHGDTTGRIETLNLWPLAQSELRGGRVNFVDALFAGRPPRLSGCEVGRNAFASIVAAGGYPEALLRTGGRHERWIESYIDSTLDRDLRDISDAVKIEEMPRLLRLIATQAANLLSYRNASGRLGLSAETVRSSQSRSRPATTIGSQDCKWLIKLREHRGSRFVAGVVIHPREQTIPLGDRLWALPIGALWA